MRRNSLGVSLGLVPLNNGPVSLLAVTSPAPPWSWLLCIVWCEGLGCTINDNPVGLFFSRPTSAYPVGLLPCLLASLFWCTRWSYWQTYHMRRLGWLTWPPHWRYPHCLVHESQSGQTTWPPHSHNMLLMSGARAMAAHLMAADSPDLLLSWMLTLPPPPFGCNVRESTRQGSVVRCDIRAGPPEEEYLPL